MKDASTPIRSRLANFLKANHIRRSESRDMVLQLLLETEDHMELSELIRRAKSKQLGEATVYRALRVFQDAGLVSRIESAAGKVSYEILREPHDHMICARCGAVTEFRSATIKKAEERIAEKHGFLIHHHRYEIFGLCAGCRNRR